MSRLSARFTSLAQEGRTALIPYITAGDPHPDQTVELMHTLVSAGADIVELGVPFSDPMADGPVIQAACERALAYKTSLSDVLEMVTTFRTQDPDTPIVLMGYQNPVDVMGAEVFASRAEKAGVDGILTVDLPIEEGSQESQSYKDHGLDTIYLLAPTTPEERISRIAQHGSGFLYYVSFKGVTGANRLDVDNARAHIEQIQGRSTLPVVIGFGIKDAESARMAGQIADGVVIGSAIVARIAQYGDQIERAKQELAELVGDIRAAMDQSSPTQRIA